MAPRPLPAPLRERATVSAGVPPGKDATSEDLSTVPLDDVLDDVERRLGRQLKCDDGHFSKYNGTAGFRTDQATWVRLAWRRTEKIGA
ncbi:hypothetical protein [Streptomyces sp. NPDC097610]|uniref:hypothetical protein n=1 Tax=Streptomyces sp. NPDC097610 TaxID=3157227 RepID=UPI0033250CC6